MKILVRVSTFFAAVATLSAANETGADTPDPSYSKYTNLISEPSGYLLDKLIGPGMILLLTIVALFAMYCVFKISSKTDQKLNQEELSRSLIVIFVSYGALLIAFSYSHSETFAAVASLLSGIIGYLFGRNVDGYPKKGPSTSE